MADVIIIVGEAKVITPLLKSDVEVLVHETKSDPLLLICIGHRTNIMRESTKKLKRQAFIYLTSLINKMVQPDIMKNKIKIISNTWLGESTHTSPFRYFDLPCSELLELLPCSTVGENNPLSENLLWLCGG